jgi:hypothetical protein
VRGTGDIHRFQDRHFDSDFGIGIAIGTRLELNKKIAAAFINIQIGNQIFMGRDDY